MDSLSRLGGGARILIVEDNVDTSWLLARTCQVAGYETTQVITGREALEELGNRAYHVVLLDLKLPDMNGIEVLKEINDRYPDLYVIILTASPSFDSAVAALRLGATDYIEKPAVARDVLTAIRNALAKRTNTHQRLVELLGIGDQMIGPENARPHATSEGQENRFETRAGNIIFEPEKQRVLINSRTVSLTQGETEVLGILLQHLDRPLSPQEIAVAAWGETLEAVNAESIIRPHIYRLRQKLESEPSSPRIISTVRGKGYVIHSSSTW